MRYSGDIDRDIKEKVDCLTRGLWYERCSSNEVKDLHKRALKSTFNPKAVRGVVNSISTPENKFSEVYDCCYTRKMSVRQTAVYLSMTVNAVYAKRNRLLHRLTLPMNLIRLMSLSEDVLRKEQEKEEEITIDTTFADLAKCRPLGYDPRTFWHGWPGPINAVARRMQYKLGIPPTIKNLMELEPDKLYQVRGLGWKKASQFLYVLKFYGFDYGARWGFGSVEGYVKAYYNYDPSTVSEFQWIRG